MIGGDFEYRLDDSLR